ncbi:MAG: thiamine pyrophosphate-dependent enzyme [Candidatus Thorarchaeota archaeon]
MTPANHAKIMSGNEAIARGALEASIGFCSSYPGTPSTEITTTLQQLAEENNIYVEWSVNEKIALEAAAGASWAGVPSICSMKSLGLNVASDFLLNLNLSGTGPGGLVIVVCDDPRGHSSSNEQDSRFYAKAAQIPLLEPSTYQEAKDVIPFALKVSKEHQVPIIVRSTTRLSHSRGLVVEDEIPKRSWHAKQLNDNLFNVPTPHLKHRDLLNKMEQIRKIFEKSSFNRIPEGKEIDVLIISSGISRRYSEEAIHLLDTENIEVLNLVTTYPLPIKIVETTLDRAKQILFSEEIDPFVEDEVSCLAIKSDNSYKFHGKRTGVIPAYGEMSTDIMREAIARLKGIKTDKIENPDSDILIPRPLTFCAGCTHRNFYWAVRKVRKRVKDKLVVAGDIGCYSLGVFYDRAMTTMQAMGSGIGVASGLGQLERFGFDDKVLAVAGDSTFFHSCIPGLINAKHKGANLTFVVLDNETTAMTGFQTHPGAVHQESNLNRVRIEDIVKAINPDFFARSNADNIPELTELLHSTVNRDGLKVLLLDSICRLEIARRKPAIEGVSFKIDKELCKGEKCLICVQDFACPAFNWDNITGIPEIIEQLCVKCGACVAVCPHDAIKEEPVK